MRAFVLLSGDNNRFIKEGFKIHKSLLPINEDGCKTTLEHIVYELGQINKFIDKYKKDNPIADCNAERITQVYFVLRGNRAYDDGSIELEQQDSIIRAISTINAKNTATFDISIIYDSPLKAGALYSAYNAIGKAQKIEYSNENILLINCDQIVSFNSTIAQELDVFNSNDYLGGILHADSSNVKEKYRKLFGYSVVNQNLIYSIFEKDPISNHLHTGHYFIKDADTFYNYCLKVFKEKKTLHYQQFNEIVNTGEYFISTLFQEMLDDNKNVIRFNWLGSVDNFISVGTPELYTEYLLKDYKI